MSEYVRPVYTYACHRCSQTVRMYHAPGSILMDIVLEANGWSRSIFHENPYRVFCPACTVYRKGQP